MDAETKEAFAVLLKMQQHSQKETEDLKQLVKGLLLEKKSIEDSTRVQSKATDKTNVIMMLNTRIPTFSYRPDDSETFDNWYGRYESIIEKEGTELDEVDKARFIVGKLDFKESELYRNHILPKSPEMVPLNDTINMLKKLFTETKSLALRRHEFLSLRLAGQPNKEYTALVKSLFSKTQWSTVTEDSIQCLMYITGLQASENKELRLRALRELELKPDLTVVELADRLESIIALRNDNEKIGGSEINVQAVQKSPEGQQQQSRGRQDKGSNHKQVQPKRKSVSGKPPSPCLICGYDHWRIDCKFDKSIVCNKCKKTGHISRICTSSSNKEYTSNAVFIAHSSAGTGNKIYFHVVINGTPIRMQLDTGAEQTLLNTKDWIRLQKPKLSTPTVSLRSVNRTPIEVKGQFSCNFVINGQSGSGQCYVAETPSLLGMDWISQSRTLYGQLIHHAVNAFKQVKLTNAYGRCMATTKMKNQFNRRHGTTEKQFSMGDTVYVRDYRSIKTNWIPGIIIGRAGKVKYRVKCNGQLWERHANQLRLRERHQKTSNALLDLFDLPLTPTSILEMNCASPTSHTVPSSRTPTSSIAKPTMQTTTSTVVQPPAAPALRRSTRPTKAPVRLNMDPTKTTYR